MPTLILILKWNNDINTSALDTPIIFKNIFSQLLYCQASDSEEDLWITLTLTYEKPALAVFYPELSKFIWVLNTRLIIKALN